jgi:hypothetical protein
MGRAKALHVILYHGGDKIVPVVDIDPDGSVGEACVDRMLKLMDDLEALGPKMTYTSAKYRRVISTMQAECEQDIQQLSIAAKEKAWGNSSESAGAE